MTQLACSLLNEIALWIELGGFAQKKTQPDEGPVAVR